MAERDDFKRGYWSRVEIPTRMQIFFLLIFVYKLISTNSYMLLRLYQFVHFLCDFYTNSYILYKLYSTNSYNKPRGRSPSTPPAPTRPHPAAPTLGYTRLPRPVRVRSWGGWVRNGIKITIRKMRLYKFIRLTYIIVNPIMVGRY